jgi:hypothetical protein
MDPQPVENTRVADFVFCPSKPEFPVCPQICPQACGQEFNPPGIFPEDLLRFFLIFL